MTVTLEHQNPITFSHDDDFHNKDHYNNSSKLGIPGEPMIRSGAAKLTAGDRWKRDWNAALMGRIERSTSFRTPVTCL